MGLTRRERAKNLRFRLGQMRFVDAYWELENSGKRVCEIIFENSDTSQQYPEESVRMGFDYVVAKIPAGNFGLTHDLENMGFRYLENQFRLTFDIKENLELTMRWRARVSKYSFTHIESPTDIVSVINEINHEMFISDRVTIDPFWSNEVTGRRYGNWLFHLNSEGRTGIYVMKDIDGNERGFFTMRDEGSGICSCPLAGIYTTSTGKGYFLPLSTGFFQKASEAGYSKMKTSISSNNRAIMRFFSKLFFYSIDESLVVLRKVLDEGK